MSFGDSIPADPLFSVTGEPTGFPNRTDSAMSFIDGTRTFEIAPVGVDFSYYIAGRKYTVTATDSIVIADTEGIWFLYYDGAILTAVNQPDHDTIKDIIENHAWVAGVFWDADNGKGQLTEERHGLTMDSATHVYLHETVGTRFDSGLALNSILADENGSLDSHAQFGTDVGQIFDEDIEHALNAVSSITGLQIWHQDVSGWTFTTNAGFSMLTAGSGRLAYDNSGTLTEVTNGNFVLCHVFATNFSDANPIVILGQTEYSTKKTAQQGALTEMLSLLVIAGLSPELKPIASVIFQTKNTYSNSVKARIVSTDTGDDYVDFRTDALSPAFASAQDHKNLANVGTNTHDEIDAYIDAQDALSDIVQDPTGFKFSDDTDNVLSFDDGTKTFTITPTGASFDYYIKGEKFTQVGADSIEIADTEGLHFIYYNDSGALVDDLTPPPGNLLFGVAYIAFVVWDVTNQNCIIFGNERHGLSMSWATHHHFHFALGALYIDGLAMTTFTIDGDGSSDSHSQFAVADGEIHDEDIDHETTDRAQTLTFPSEIPILWRSGASSLWRKKDANTYPLILNGEQGYTGASGRPAYNELTGGAWQLTEVPNNDFFLIHYFATNDVNTMIVGILGESVYNNKSAARDGAQTEIANITGLPLVESVLIGTVIFKTTTGYANVPKAIIASTDTGDDYVDWREIDITAGGGGGHPVSSIFGRTGAVAAQSGDYTPTQVGLGDVNNSSLTNGLLEVSGSNAKLKIARDIDVQGKKAIAMVTDNGATFPLSPVANQEFIHTPIGRTVSNMFDGSAWQPIFLFGAATIYIDKLGTDDQDNGLAADSTGFLTIPFGIDQFPKNGDPLAALLIYLGDGTFQETGTFTNIKYPVTVNGETTKVIDGNIATGGAQYTGGVSAHTKATLTDTGLIASAHKAELMVTVGGTGSGQERQIYDNTTGAFEIIGLWSTLPDNTTVYDVLSYDTIIEGQDTNKCLVITNCSSVTFNRIKTLNGAPFDYEADNKSTVSIRSSLLDDTTANQNNKKGVISQNYSTVSLRECHVRFASSALAGSEGVKANIFSSIDPLRTWFENMGEAVVAGTSCISTVNQCYIENTARDGIRGIGTATVNILNTVVDNAGVIGVRGLTYATLNFFSGNEINNSASDGVLNSRQGTTVRAGTTRISNNGGWGLQSTILTTGVGVSLFTYFNNTFGTHNAPAAEFCLNT